MDNLKQFTTEVTDVHGEKTLSYSVSSVVK